jgi:hypothetical protein
MDKALYQKGYKMGYADGKNKIVSKLPEIMKDAYIVGYRQGEYDGSHGEEYNDKQFIKKNQEDVDGPRQCNSNIGSD